MAKKQKNTGDMSETTATNDGAEHADTAPDEPTPALGDIDGAPIKPMTLAQLKAAYEDANDRSEVAALERNDFGTKIAAAMSLLAKGKKGKPTITLGGVRFRVTVPRDGEPPALLKIPSVEYVDLDADPAS